LASFAAADLVDFAEAPSWFMTSRPGRVVRVKPGYALFADVGTTYCAVEGVRLREDELDVAIADVDAFMHETDTKIASWWLTERSTPDEDAFLRAGLTRNDEDYLHAAMVLTQEPPASEVEAREVTTREEYVEARRLGRTAFNAPFEDFDAEFAAPHDPLYAAWLDGKMASVGRASFTPVGAYLTGGATAEWARGRGAYRAVVRARWDAAVERGTPVLAVGAGPMSRPILERLGFEQVLEYRRLQTTR
jgi:hypothetical protein